LQQTQAVCAADDPTDTDSTVTNGRARHETSTVEVFEPATAIAGSEWKPLARQIVRVTREVLHRSSKTGL
jgi:hypothetical protein